MRFKNSNTSKPVADTASNFNIPIVDGLPEEILSKDPSERFIGDRKSVV